MISGAGAAPGTQGAQGSVFEALLALMLSDRLGDKVQVMPARDPELDHVRNAIRDGLVATLGSNGDPTAEPRKR